MQFFAISDNCGYCNNRWIIQYCLSVHLIYIHLYSTKERFSSTMPDLMYRAVSNSQNILFSTLTVHLSPWTTFSAHNSLFFFLRQMLYTKITTNAFYQNIGDALFFYTCSWSYQRKRGTSFCLIILHYIAELLCFTFSLLIIRHLSLFLFGVLHPHRPSD